MIEEASPQTTVVRTSRGLSIAGTRITLYDMVERLYRERCAEQLLEVVLDLDSYRGTARIFIPW